MKRQAEMIEGPEAWERFEGAVKKILTVPHAEVQRRIAEYRKASASNPNRRGPKRKG
jgi:regulator of protease activity HflC (stomatin/prohibitin superfamily)